MSGAASRRRGHAWEVQAARELAAATGLEVVTTRAVGASYGADLCVITAHDRLGRAVAHVPHVNGFSVEAKNVAIRSPKAWLQQAIDQSLPGTTPVVLWKRRGKSFRSGSAFLIDDAAPRGWVELTIGEWIDRRLTRGQAA